MAIITNHTATNETDNGKVKKTAKGLTAPILRDKKLEELQALKAHFESLDANKYEPSKHSFLTLVKSILF